MNFPRSIILFALAVVCLTAAVDAQTKRRTKPVVKKPAVVASPSSVAVEEKPTVVSTKPKKNERPAARGAATKEAPTVQQAAVDQPYFYQFSQPDFDTSKIIIQHDETGRGTITFTKRMFSVTETDPLQVSTAAMERINGAYDALNFLDSTDNYQYEKDYSHLGVATFKLKKAAKQRTATFNYTINKEAKKLLDEYRKLSNQFIWIFEITVARENQPLEAPKLLDALDALIRRNEISDPSQMGPLLNELANDERIPLIARNHARKLAAKIGRKW